VGQSCIPAGTELNAPTWNGIALPLPMPINAMALDEDVALMMLKWYEDYLWQARSAVGQSIRRT
jgi:hypothetical protein